MNRKEARYGKGRIMSGLTLEEAFQLIRCIPDCKLPEDNSIHYGHRALEGIDIYFVSNQANEVKEIQPEFRVTESNPSCGMLSMDRYDHCLPTNRRAKRPRCR